MRMYLFVWLMVLGNVSWASELDVSNWRCKPTGGYEEYQNTVAGIKQKMLDLGIPSKVVAYLDQYADKPDMKALKQIRADNEDRCDGVKKSYNIIRDFSHVKKSRHNKPPVDRGLKYYDLNRDTHREIAEQYGVDLSLATAIQAKETWMCEYPLDHKVLHALLTAAYFFDGARDDLYNPVNEVYFALKMIEDGHIQNEEKFKGSYMGALGCPQFLPSSVYKYAVDQDEDGRIDLYNSHADIIGSISNYMSVFNYTKGEGWCEAVKFEEGHHKVVDDIVREKEGFHSGYSSNIQKTAQQWAQDEDLKLVLPEELLAEEGKNYRFLLYYYGGEVKGCLTGDNFEAIRRYNLSIKYVFTILYIMETVEGYERENMKERVINPPLEVKEVQTEPLVSNITQRE